MVACLGMSPIYWGIWSHKTLSSQHLCPYGLRIATACLNWHAGCNWDRQLLPVLRQRARNAVRGGQAARGVRLGSEGGRVAVSTKGFGMAKRPENENKHWTPQDIRQLERLADQNTPTRLIAYKLGRSEDSVRSKASEEDISLKPTNQSPYNRIKR